MLKRVTALTYLDGAFCALMVGFGETIAITYLSDLKLPSVTLGLLTTVPAAIGALTQAAVPFVFNRCSSVRLTILSVAVQVVGLLLLGFFLSAEHLNYINIGLALSLYWIGGMTSGAPWQDWLFRLVPERLHSSYFAKRTAILSLVLLFSYFVAGFLLHGRLTQTWAASLIFASVGFRLVSLCLLFSHPRPPKKKKHDAGEYNFFDPLSKNDDLPELSLGVLCLFSFLHKAAVCVSGPFFAPYMLQELNLSILPYFVLTAVPLMVRFLFLVNWGRLLDDRRLFEGLFICVVGIAMLPVLWSINSSTSALVVWQVMSGLVWSGYELVTIIFIQRLYPNAIMQSLALFSASGSLGNALGGYFGGLIKDAGYTYESLFNVSTLLRTGTGLLLLMYLRRKSAFRFRSLELRAGMTTVLSVRPSLGMIGRMVPIVRPIKEKLWKS